MNEHDKTPHTLGQRFTMMRERLELTVSDFAHALGLDEETIEAIEKDAYTPDADDLKRLVACYQVNSDWLLTGQGSLFNPEVEFSEERTIPLISVDAQADYLDSNGSHEFVSSLQRYKFPGFEQASNMRVFEVQGEDMIPTFYPGDHLVCSPISDRRKIAKDSLAVVVAKDFISVNRVSYYDSEQHDALILQSDKSTTPPRMVSMGDVREVWCVELRMTTSFDHILLFNHQKFVVLEQELVEMKSQLRHLQDFFQQLNKRRDD